MVKRKDFSVFLSSTFSDLRPERRAVEEILHRLSTTEFRGMEYFGSRPETPVETSLAEVRRADVYLAVIGERYGTIDSVSGKSITELEYRTASAEGKPCLIYLQDCRGGTTSKGRGKDPESYTKLRAFKNQLRRERTVSLFKNPGELGGMVAVDIANFLSSDGVNVPPQGLPTLHTIICKHFDFEELRTLCFDLDVDFDELRGEGKAGRARELILYLQRRDKLTKLKRRVQEARPNLNI